MKSYILTKEARVLALLMPWLIFGILLISQLYLPLRGGDFMWSSSGHDPLASRLDHFLVSADWEEFFVDMIQKRMSTLLSDHFPICLETSVSVRGKSPFRFENMWLEFEGFADLIKEWWGEVQVQGFASFIVAKKLQYIKEKLKIWNRKVFGDIKMRKHNLLGSINSLDNKEESCGLTEVEFQ